MQFKAQPKTDQTAPLQAFLNANKNVEINDPYIISDSLVVPSGGSLTGTGALIASDKPKGLLKSNGLFINQTKQEKTTIGGITFQGANMTVAPWGSAAIWLKSSLNCFVEDCLFDFNFTYGKGMDAVWVGASKYATIRRNKCKTVGITYAENGSSYGLCEGNEIYNAYANGLGGIGNDPKSPNYNNTVRGNYIENCGRMGIEDQQNSIGTIIEGNMFKGTGKFDKEGIAISAVGMDATVRNNCITDYINYGIELAGKAGNKAVRNIVYDNGNNTGIITNFKGSKVTDRYETVIENNVITGAKVAIKTFGISEDQLVSISQNSLISFLLNGIELNTGNAINNRLSVFDNTFVLGGWNGDRCGISAYSNLPNGKQGGLYQFNQNTFLYTGKNNGYDSSILSNFDNVNVADNTAIGNPGKLTGFTTNGTKPVGLVEVNNKW